MTKLLHTKFNDLKAKPDIEIGDVKTLEETVTQKQKTLIDLNAKILEQISEEEDFEQELTDADEHMYVLDS